MKSWCMHRQTIELVLHLKVDSKVPVVAALRQLIQMQLLMFVSASRRQTQLAITASPWNHNAHCALLD